MKKLLLLFSCFMVLTLFTGCGENAKYIKEIGYLEFETMIKDKKSFILEVMSTDCSACKDFSPKLIEVTNEHSITVYKINAANIKDEDWDKLSGTYSVSSTPTTMFFTEGKEETVATRIVGSVSKDKITDKFKTMGYIK